MRALSLSFAGALLLSTSALANNPAWLERVDANGDGFVTAAESADYEAWMYSRLDANNDGIITKGEWEGTGDFYFDYVDINSDGVVLPEEARAAYTSSYRYYGVMPDAEPLLTVSPSGTVVTHTTSYPPAAPYQQQVQTYTYSYNGPPPYGYAPNGFVPYNYQQVISPPVAYVEPVPTLRKRVPDEVYMVPQYVVPGYPNTQRIVEQQAYSNATSDGVYQGNPFALDNNRDGVLTIDEVLVYNHGNFLRHDQNRNGYLESYEWDLKAQEHFGHRVNPAVLGTLTHDTFGRHDRDGDGRVSKQEWDAQIDAEFQILDSDGDRRLAKTDFQLAGG